MFTGIIEHTGTIDSLQRTGEGARLVVRAPALAPSLAVSGSVAVNGCCLTVVSLDGELFAADLSPETLRRTSFGELQSGARVNLERPLKAGEEFGGHFVQGHVDATGRVTQLTQQGDAWLFGVKLPGEILRYAVQKGSIAIDGISLTIAALDGPVAEIAVIPYTYAHTNLADRKPGDAVNLEADMIAKHVERFLERFPKPAASSLTLDRLLGEGF